MCIIAALNCIFLVLILLWSEFQKAQQFRQNVFQEISLNFARTVIAIFSNSIQFEAN